MLLNLQNPQAEQIVFDEVAEARYPLTEFYETAATEMFSDGSKNGHDLAKQLLFTSVDVPMLVADKNKEIAGGAVVRWVPSTHFGTGIPGPVKEYEVMVVGKCPGLEEKQTGQNFVGPSGKLIKSVAESINLDWKNWYVTNLVHFVPPTGDITPQQIKDGMFMLAQEIALVRPKYMLLFGADAVKAICGKKATLTKIRSEVFLLPGVAGLGTLPQLLRDSSVMEREYDNIKVLATVHPAAVLREVGYQHGFRRDMELFRNLLVTQGHTPSPAARDYRYVTGYAELKAVVDEIVNGGFRKISIDCEWGDGNFMCGRLRTVQFSWKSGSSCVSIFYHKGGKLAQTSSEAMMMVNELRRLVTTPGMKIIGHNLRADAKWLEGMGIPVIENLYFDTMLADHMLNENAEHGLEACAVRYTDMGRYDYVLTKYVADNSVDVKRRGYMDIPDEILYPYAACDSDATFRCEAVISDMLVQPRNSSLQWCYYNVVLPANLPIHEIEVSGLMVDRPRMVELVKAYDVKKLELLDRLKVMTANMTFNPRSYVQVTKLLFGPKPDGLGMTPFKTTEKPARMWDAIQSLPLHEINRLNPSTDAETLEALADQHPVVKALHDFKIIDQVAKSFLRLPEDGDDTYLSGLVGSIDPDGRIRTSLNQMSETGRHKSSNPNMQNLPKKQEKEMERIMGDDVNSIRSCFVAPPGHVLIEVDYKSAEIYTLGYLSNCDDLVKDAAADLHARGAVNYFGCDKWPGFEERRPPPKDWLTKFKSPRVGAKTVNFGIPYQRGAAAVARQIIRETKGAIQCTKDQSQGYIDGYYSTYPPVGKYVGMCKWCANNSPYYIANPYGRRRRFQPTTDRTVQAAQEREIVNFPIQSTVADTLNIALQNLFHWRLTYPGLAIYKILLAIHDACLLEVPVDYIGIVTERVLPECMKFGAPIPSWCPVEGWQPTQPFMLDIDISLGLRWGTEATPEELKAAGVADTFIERFA